MAVGLDRRNRGQIVPVPAGGGALGACQTGVCQAQHAAEAGAVKS